MANGYFDIGGRQFNVDASLVSLASRKNNVGFMEQLMAQGMASELTAPAPVAPAPVAAPPPQAPAPQQQQQISAPQPSAVNEVRENAKKAKGKKSTLLTKYGSSRSRGSAKQAANTAALGLASSTKKTLLGAA